MSVEPDDLEKLLHDVRKTIKENAQFLSTLAEEPDQLTEIDDELEKEEDFEEL